MRFGRANNRFLILIFLWFWIGQPISNLFGQVPIADFLATPLTGCAPLTVNFTDISVGNPTTWEWDVDNDGIVDYISQNATHTYTTAGTYSVLLVITNANGSDLELESNIITVLPEVLAYAGNDTTICGGRYTYFNLHGSTAGGTPPFTYNWAPPDDLGSPEYPDATVWEPSTTNFTFTVTDQNGCSDMDSILVNVLQGPPVGIYGLEEGYCWGDPPDTIYGYPPGGTFSWPAENGILIPYGFGPPTSYGVTYSFPDPNGCTYSYTQMFSLYMSAETPVIFQSGNLLYAPNTRYHSYQWYLNNDPIPDATNDSLVTHTSGTYTVLFRTNNNCSALSGPFPFNPIPDPPQTDTFSVGPNPAYEYLIIKGFNQMSNVIFVICDINGKVVLKESIIDPTPETKINLSKLGSGIYFLEVRTPEWNRIQKIIKIGT